jgi:hypothetical protein
MLERKQPYVHASPKTGRFMAGIRRERKDFIVAPMIAPRDPCPRCGVRRDIGCGHSLERLGMVL